MPSAIRNDGSTAFNPPPPARKPYQTCMPAISAVRIQSGMKRKNFTTARRPARIRGVPSLLECVHQRAAGFFRSFRYLNRGEFPAAAIKPRGDQGTERAERGQHALADLPALAAIRQQQVEKRPMLASRLFEFLLAGLAVAHDRSLHLADFPVLRLLDAARQR